MSHTSSFIMLSSRSDSFSPDDSDDEIVYSISDISISTSNGSIESYPASDDDFVVLSRPRSPKAVDLSASNAEDNGDRANTPTSASCLASDLEKLSVDDSHSAHSHKPSPSKKVKAARSKPLATDAAPKSKRKRKAARAATKAKSSSSLPASSPSDPQHKVIPPPSRTKVKKAAKLKAKKSKKAVSAAMPQNKSGSHPILDDSSERFSENGDTKSTVASPSIYEEAVGYITSFLSNPAARKDSACRLTLLQALIIELGFAYSSLPSSLTAAKAFLKSRAFLNVREYLAVREKGPAAVREIMHPSRNALIKDIKKKRNPAPLGWVKDSGLQVLLVPCYH